MLGKAQNIRGKKVDIYLNKDFNRKANKGLSGNVVWNFDVLEAYTQGYKVTATRSEHGDVGSRVFNPVTFYLKTNALNVTLNKPSTPKPKPNTPKPSGKTIPLEDGDTMQLLDKNGVKLGVWTFKKE